MEVLYPRCAGLDVHKDGVVACIRIASGGEVVTEVQTFDTTTASLVRLSEWLASNGSSHVAMEATGVYWKPVWHILSDSEFTLIGSHRTSDTGVGTLLRQDIRWSASAAWRRAG